MIAIMGSMIVPSMPPLQVIQEVLFLYVVLPALGVGIGLITVSRLVHLEE
jgi:hypothetical protein